MGRFSLLALKRKRTCGLLASHGLHSTLLHLDNASTIHCWAPTTQDASKPPLLLLHGFGADGTMAWENQVPSLARLFSLYLPDLIFFGQSTTTTLHRCEFFQADCMLKSMLQLGVQQAIVAGHSYGGFVAFRMAQKYPDFVVSLVIVSSGICMNPESNGPVLERFGVTDIKDVLVPKSAKDLRKVLKLVFAKAPWILNFMYREMFKLMSGDRESRLQLVDGIVLGKEDSPALPKLRQEVLIIWGDQDLIFNIELAHQLKDFLGPKAELEIIKGTGHAPPIEKPKKFNQVLIRFLDKMKTKFSL